MFNFFSTYRYGVQREDGDLCGEVGQIAVGSGFCKRCLHELGQVARNLCDRHGGQWSLYPIPLENPRGVSSVHAQTSLSHG
jgi:hypothetical protein